MLDPAEYAEIGTEHAHQVALFMWASTMFNRWPELRLMFAIPNGGERNRAVAGRLKAEGVKPGVPDVFLPVPRQGHAGLFLELKRPAGPRGLAGRASAEQMVWIAQLQAQGYAAYVCAGWEAARNVLIQYLTDGSL